MCYVFLVCYDFLVCYVFLVSFHREAAFENASLCDSSGFCSFILGTFCCMKRLKGDGFLFTLVLLDSSFFILSSRSAIFSSVVSSLFGISFNRGRKKEFFKRKKNYC